MEMNKGVLPLGMTRLIDDGQTACIKSHNRGFNRCLTGSSCAKLEIQRDMGLSLACFFVLFKQKIYTFLSYIFHLFLAYKL